MNAVVSKNTKRLLAPATIAFSCLLATVSSPAFAARAYVSNEDDNTVSIIDTDKAQVVATINVGKRPRGLKLDAKGTHLYVAVSGLPKCPPSMPDDECAKHTRDANADGIAVVDTKTQKVLRVLQAGSDPEQFDVSRDGHRLFVANEDIGTMSAVDVDSGAVLARVVVGREPEGVVAAPNGKWVLVTSESDNTVTVVDAKTYAVVKQITVGLRPRDIAFTPDNAQIYVSGELDASVYRVAVPQGTPLERVIQLRRDALPMALILDAKHARLFVSTGRGGTVAVIGTADSKLIGEVRVGKRPWGMALSADGRLLYTANGPSNDVSIVDTATLKVVSTINVGRSPWGVVLGPSPP
jgi:YVTN family beta-propeller protein